MMKKEKEVYVTEDGFGRASIVERSDGLLCIYVHWIWPSSTKIAHNVELGGRENWFNDLTSPDELYYGVQPRPGLFSLINDARKEVQQLPHFGESKLASEIERAWRD